MNKKQPSKMAKDGLKCLRKAVREEVEKKALLNQYVIISRNGKTCRVLAKEALKITKDR
ncbi:MAG: hypothetical protein JXA96_11925 [Sedimentisphaerales bacterium]|nr:hypothetical protein [Sedimentisphaerales bacterium]